MSLISSSSGSDPLKPLIDLEVRKGANIEEVVISDTDKEGKKTLEAMVSIGGSRYKVTVVFDPKTMHDSKVKDTITKMIGMFEEQDFENLVGKKVTTSLTDPSQTKVWDGKKGCELKDITDEKLKQTINKVNQAFGDIFKRSIPTEEETHVQPAEGKPLSERIKKGGAKEKDKLDKFEVKFADITPKEKIAPGKQVGKLGDKYPGWSDHIAVGGSVKLKEGNDLYYASYNMGHEDYQHHFDPDKTYPDGTKGNKQGLHGSPITKYEKTKHDKYKDLTMREWNTVRQVLDMASHKTHPKAFIGLQECSRKVYRTLQSELGEINKSKGTNLKIVWPDPKEKDCAPFIYDANKLELGKESDVKLESYKGDTKKKIVDVTFKDKSSGKKIRFINTHVSKGKTGQLAEHLKKAAKDGIPTIVMGDMNDKTKDTDQVIRKQTDQFTPVTTSEPTHVNAKQMAEDYDQIYASKHDDIENVSVINNPNEIFGENDLSENLRDIRKIFTPS